MIRSLRKYSVRAVPFVFIAAYVLVTPSGALALSAKQKGIFQSGIYQYNEDVETKECAVDISSSSLTGSDNPEKAFRYLMTKGVLTTFQAAGIVGNLMWESGGVDPTSSSNGGGTVGIAQWEGGRDDALKKFAKDAGKPWQDLGIQLDYLWHELNTSEKAALEAVKATETVENATIAFEEKFERAGKPVMDRRIANAKEIMSKYGGTSEDAVNTVSVVSSTCSGATGGGEASQYVDGFTVYSQYDTRWANAAYGSSTIRDSGCGPSAMAMIITALTKKNVTPLDTTKYANTKSLYVAGSGSSWTIAPILSDKWGLTAKPIGNDVAKINATLQAGGMVIGSGAGPKPFTSGGHYIVIRALTADGKWMVGDSAHKDTNTRAYTPSEIVTYMKGGSVYAITK